LVLGAGPTHNFCLHESDEPDSCSAKPVDVARFKLL
jgi:hypothetical protein